MSTITTRQQWIPSGMRLTNCSSRREESKRRLKSVATTGARKLRSNTGRGQGRGTVQSKGRTYLDLIMTRYKTRATEGPRTAEISRGGSLILRERQSQIPQVSLSPLIIPEEEGMTREGTLPPVQRELEDRISPNSTTALRGVAPSLLTTATVQSTPSRPPDRHRVHHDVRHRRLDCTTV